MESINSSPSPIYAEGYGIFHCILHPTILHSNDINILLFLQLSILETLVHHGADLEARTKTGETPLGEIIKKHVSVYSIRTS